MMILAALLATTGLVTLAGGSPMRFTTYRRREIPVDLRPELLLLYDQRGLEKINSVPRSIYDVEGRDYGNEVGSRVEVSDAGPMTSIVGREKKMGLARNSLSIVNPIDVLRQRVMLELRRRQAMKEQRQIDANRVILETIGKRSVHQPDSVYPARSVLSGEDDENTVFASDGENVGRREPQQYQSYTQRMPLDRTHRWYDVDGAVTRDDSDDDAPKVHSTYRQDRM